MTSSLRRCHLLFVSNVTFSFDFIIVCTTQKAVILICLLLFKNLFFLFNEPRKKVSSSALAPPCHSCKEEIEDCCQIFSPSLIAQLLGCCRMLTLCIFANASPWVLKDRFPTVLLLRQVLPKKAVTGKVLQQPNCTSGTVMKALL